MLPILPPLKTTHQPLLLSLSVAAAALNLSFCQHATTLLSQQANFQHDKKAAQQEEFFKKLKLKNPKDKTKPTFHNNKRKRKKFFKKIKIPPTL
jgi:hypothetical protein